MIMNCDLPTVPSDYIVACTHSRKDLQFLLPAIFQWVGINYPEFIKRPFPLSINQVRQLVVAMHECVRVPHAGLETGRQMPLASHGLAATAILAQPTFAECLQVASRLYNKSFPALSLQYFESAGQAGVRITERVSLSPVSHYFIEAITVSFYSFLHFLLGGTSEPAFISFAYDEPDYRLTYDRYLKCPLQFNSKYNEFVISKQLAQQKLLPLMEAGISMGEAGFPSPSIGLEVSCLSKRLRLLLVQNIGALPSEDAAARQLGISSRTLRRQLHSAGTHYQQELDLLRRQIAINYLTKSDRCITDVALLLGFCDSSAFSKAFKKWTGVSPRKFKRRQVLRCEEDIAAG